MASSQDSCSYQLLCDVNKINSFGLYEARLILKDNTANEISHIQRIKNFLVI